MKEKTEKWLYYLQWITITVGILAVLFLSTSAEGVDNKTKKVVLKKWTTQIIYDTTNACYEGTIKWIVLSNPSLFGQMPNLQSQRQMIVHCFCVMDKIKKEFKIEEYQKLVYDPEWVGTLFMTRAMECVKEEKTLPSFFTTQVEEDNKKLAHQVEDLKLNGVRKAGF